MITQTGTADQGDQPDPLIQRKEGDHMEFMLGSIEFCNMEPIRTILQDMGIWEEGCFFLDPDEELVNEVESRLLTL